MADEEVEQFEITDYDLDNEFNINRPVRKLSKNQQIYGVWADDSDNEGQSSSRSSFKKPGGRHAKNYSDPIGFICGGVQQAGKDKPPKTVGSHKDEDDEGEEDDENDEEENTKTGKNVIRGSSSSSEEDEEMGRASFRNMSIGNMEGDIAGLRKKRNLLPPQLIQRGVGNWEKHTKGIGAKLLLQMGFQPGRGLGKDLQGIQAPIEATLRKGRGAIGAYGPEKLQKVSSLREEEKKAHGNEKDGGKSTGEVSQWRKEGGTSKKKKVRYFYKSIEEVLEESKLPGKKREFSELTRVKVIDMTGPQQRVLSGYHAISGVQKPTDQWEIRKDKKFTNFALPELQHNLNLLVDMCEEAIIQNDRQLRYSEDRIVGVEAEVESLSKVVVQEEQIIAALETVLGRIELLSASAKDNTLTLKEAADAILELQEKYYSEYCMYEVPALATGIVRPLLKEHLATWNPLQDPTQPIATFQQWKDILETQPTHNYAQQTHDPYHRLLWDAWMPCIRIAVNAWKVRECTPMIELIEHWMPLIPAWILDNILQQLVLPKLQLEVEEWNPLTDTIPIHSWIHPWIPLLGKRLSTQAFPVIRHKLSTALVSWHPSDRSARLMLQPWVAVFSQGEMDAFLVNHIVPKLHLALQELIINPHQQHLDNWQWVMDWSEILPVHVLASVLDTSFFPKWLQVLTLWLNLNPNYDQVTNWYKQWKGMISDKLQQQPAIKEHFRTALDLMSRAVGGPVSQPPTESTQQSRYQGMAECVRTAAQIPQGFRELVEKRCEERGIVWLPLANRYREGKQIYRCGKMQVYIDRNVLFISDNGVSWDPASIQLLLERAV